MMILSPLQPCRRSGLFLLLALVLLLSAPLGACAQDETELAGSEKPLVERLVKYLGRLHPITVHFPIALALCAGLLELPLLRRGRPAASEPVRIMLGLATASSFLAVPLGWMSAATVDHSDDAAILEGHRWFGTAAGVTILITWLLARSLRARRDNKLLRRSYYAVLLASCIGISIAAHLGGALIYGLDYWNWE